MDHLVQLTESQFSRKKGRDIININGTAPVTKGFKPRVNVTFNTLLKHQWIRLTLGIAHAGVMCASEQPHWR